MKSIAKSLKLTSYDDLLSSAGECVEKVQEIPLSALHTFANHPFKVLDDEKMQETVESIEKYGVLVPALVRPRAAGGYELISGHRRRRASELAQKETMPVLVRNMSDDEAIIVMVDSNLQRESLLPSEKAFAYKMKLDALRHQGVMCGQVGHKSREQLAENAPDSGRMIQRYIRLTEILPKLLDMVDEKILAFITAVEISYLEKSEQEMLLAVMERSGSVPSRAQAVQMRKHSEEGTLDSALIEMLLAQRAEAPLQISLKKSCVKKYFPRDFSPKQIESVILELLEKWHKKKIG